MESRARLNKSNFLTMIFFLNPLVNLLIIKEVFLRAG